MVLPAWPDLAEDHPEQWRAWLAQVWALPGFAEAVTGAAPELAAQINRTLSGGQLPLHRLRRLTESTVRYLLRWTTRATPFGTFAGVAPVQFGARAAVRVGDAHRTVVRPDGDLIAEQATQSEQDLTILRTVSVVTNSLGYRRGGRWVLPCARTDGQRRFDLEVRLTQPIRVATQAARSPISFTDLAARIGGPMHVAEAERLLAGLLRAGVMVSALRPAMTVTDPAAHLAQHRVHIEPPSRIAVDQRADVTVTLPPAVVMEAGRAVSTLVAVATRFPGWDDYHRAFIERWGPGAAVPVRQMLSVLGLPAGFRGSTRRVPASFTTRDRLLGHLAQQAALDGNAEVVLDDALIDRLRAGDDRPPIPHTELRFSLAADTLQDLDRGAFTLTVLSGSRHAGVAAARFLHLLDPAERVSFQHVYDRLPTAQPGADTVQLSGPPLDARLTAVARTPELLPVLPIGEFHPAPPFTIDDLAVAGDGHRLWLVSQTTGRPVEALLFNSVLLASLQQPLMRFLTEIWAAWTAPCQPFDWGHAHDLPFLPRLRRGRTIVHPARWLIDPTALPAPDMPWSYWYDAWRRFREQRRIPQQVLVGADDVRMRLNLDDPAHVGVLRGQLARQPRTVITEAPWPAGWIGDRPAELLLTVTDPKPVAELLRASQPTNTVQYWPGRSPWVEARLYGRLDDILGDLANRPADHLPVGWWFLRYPDPEPHLRFRLPLAEATRFGDVAHHLAGWAQQLHEQDAVHDYSLHTYRPETRYGTGATLAAAEAVFAADSLTAVQRLNNNRDRQAVTAAGMIAIADGFTGDGLGWLATHVPHRTGPRLEQTQLELTKTPLRDAPLTAALTSYRNLIDGDRLDPDDVLTDLIHLHHVRMIGVDQTSEQHCARLARSIARGTRTLRAS